MRPRVIAHDQFAPRGIGDNGDTVSNPQRLLGENLVRDQSRDRIKRSLYFRKSLRFRIVVKRPGVRDLPARLGVDDGAVKYDFAALARLQLADRAVLGDDGLDTAILCAC